MRIDVIDNGGQYVHRIARTYDDLDVESNILPNTTPIEELQCDALVLSGGPARIGWESEDLGNCFEYVQKYDGPLLGLCVGHQVMAFVLGGKAGPSEVPEFGKTEITIDTKDVLFHGLPTTFTVWESHNDEILKLPEGFVALAHSDSCRFQAMRHRKKPLFGLQFHPEVRHTDHGAEILGNFARVLEEI